jgi:hypothetical protein
MLCTGENMHMEPKLFYFYVWSIAGNYVTSRLKEEKHMKCFQETL